MDEQTFRKELDIGKPLFSLQINEELVQKIFLKLNEQIKEQNKEISILKEELSLRPSLLEFNDLKNTISQMKEQIKIMNLNHITQYETINESLTEKSSTINTLVQQKVNDMLFSVSAAIREQAEIKIEEPKQNKNNDEKIINELKLHISKLSYRIDELKENFNQLSFAFDDSTENNNTINHKNTSISIRAQISNDRLKITENSKKIQTISERLEMYIETFIKLFPTNLQFPQFDNNFFYNKKEIPKFPTIPYLNNIQDFLLYITSTYPRIQSILREYFNMFSNIENNIHLKLDKIEFFNFEKEYKNQLKSLLTNLEEFNKRKDHLVFKEDFEDLAKNLFNIINNNNNDSLINSKCIVCGKPSTSKFTDFSKY